MDCRRCSTLFDFSEVTEDVSFAELTEFPRVVFYGNTRFFFQLPGLSQVSEDDCSICRISRIPYTDFLNDVRFDVAFPKIFSACFDSARVGLLEIGCSTKFDFPEVVTVTENALFVELGGFPKINSIDSAEFVG